jgi:putative transposase
MYFADKRLTISYLCNFFQLSRQSYYEHTASETKKMLQREIVLQLVKAKKTVLPNSGGRKMYHLIKDQLAEQELKYGRDKLFDLLREEDLLVKRKKSKIKTTDSNHQFKKYPNLLKTNKLDYIFAAVVCDITYIDTCEGFLYLALMTDVFSKRIVGFDLSDSLELEGCKRAALMFIKLLHKTYSKKFAKNTKIIHHSDHGSQYCSYIYTGLLKENDILISMGEIGNCYENAMAESMNNILKNELGMGQRFVSKDLAHKTLNQAILIYNTIRPHGSIKMATPMQMFQQNVLKLK